MPSAIRRSPKADFLPPPRTCRARPRPQCYAVSNPPITRLGAAPDYLMDLGSGAVDVSSDGGNGWTSEPLPAGVVLTTPLMCQGTSDCTAGAVLLQQGQTLAQVAPQDQSTQVGSLLGTGGQSPPATCFVDGGVGWLFGGPDALGAGGLQRDRARHPRHRRRIRAPTPSRGESASLSPTRARRPLGPRASLPCSPGDQLCRVPHLILSSKVSSR